MAPRGVTSTARQWADPAPPSGGYRYVAPQFVQLFFDSQTTFAATGLSLLVNIRISTGLQRIAPLFD
jgi:hypothetical protein